MLLLMIALAELFDFRLQHILSFQSSFEWTKASTLPTEKSKPKAEPRNLVTSLA